MESDKGPENPIKSSSIARNLGNRWKPGQSGNPNGPRPGSRHKASIFAESLFKGECGELIRKVIELAKAGDVAALKICVDRLLPPLKSRPIKFQLPELRTTSDALASLALVAEGVTNGVILPEDGDYRNHIDLH